MGLRTVPRMAHTFGELGAVIERDLDDRHARRQQTRQ
jgi:hypothetical protein